MNPRTVCHRHVMVLAVECYPKNRRTEVALAVVGAAVVAGHRNRLGLVALADRLGDHLAIAFRWQ